MATEGVELHVRHRRIGPARLFFVSAFALVVLLISAGGVALLVTEHRIRAELARIRAAGEPVTPADLEALYSVPPGSRDTTELWMKACEGMRDVVDSAEASSLPMIGDEPRELPQPGEPWPEQAAVEQFLAKHAERLATLHEVAAIPGHARYPTRFDNMDTMPKPLFELSRAAKLLALECEVHIRRGDSHAAVGSIHAIFASSRSAEPAPLYMALVARVVGDATAAGCLERLLAAVDLPDDDLAAIDADLAAIDCYPQLHRALLGERVFALKTYDSEPIDGWTQWGALFRKADRAVYLQIMGEIIAASTAKDHLSLQAEMKDIHARVRKAFESPVASWRYPFTKVLLPPTENLADSAARGTARRNVARTAIAVERFRRTQGQLPESLGDLVPDFLPQVPTDPFGGAPLRWAISGEDCRIYSVGKDGIDQGGSVKETISGGDIVFRLRRRKAAEKSSVSE